MNVILTEEEKAKLSDFQKYAADVGRAAEKVVGSLTDLAVTLKSFKKRV